MRALYLEAGVVDVAMIPCVVVYVSLQRFYVRGLVSGALKGSGQTVTSGGW